MTATRFAVDVGGRMVHGRREGAGPAVVLLHGSPNWSGSLQPVIDALKDRFTAIALDTPGNGCSDPLRHPDPEATDYAAALRETLDALGLGRIAVYGFHTGAGTAIEFLKSNPDRVTTVVCDGYAAFDDAERAHLLASYLTPFVPDWSGAHLAWLWSRCMEQTIFFPWHDASAATRMVYAVPDPAALTASAMDFLRAGDAYRAPYAAAFKRRGIEGARGLPKPVLIGAMSSDPLSVQLDRLSPLENGGVIERFGADRAAALRRIADWLARFPADAPPPAPNGTREGFVSARGAQLAWRGRRAGAGRPLVLLHDAGGSARLFDGIDAGDRPSIAIDLPGHGESGGAESGEVAAFAAWIADAMDAMGLSGAAVAGFHLGAQIALALKAARPDLVARAALIGAPVYGPGEAARFAERYCPSIAPRFDGGHLLTAWHLCRLRALFFPWFETNPAGMIDGEPHADPRVIHRQAVDLLKCGDRYRDAYAAQFAFDTAAALRAVPDAALLAAPWDPLMRSGRWTRVRPDARAVDPLPASPAAWGEALSRFAG